MDGAKHLVRSFFNHYLTQGEIKRKRREANLSLLLVRLSLATLPFHPPTLTGRIA